MISNDPRTFTVDVKGSTTHTNYQGQFKVRPLLSWRQKLQRDEMKRQLLGTLPEGATQDALKTAIIFSTIWAHLVDAPSWWKDAANGIDLIDEEPVTAVIDKIVDITNETIGSIEKDGEKAKTEVAELQKK